MKLCIGCLATDIPSSVSAGTNVLSAPRSGTIAARSGPPSSRVRTLGSIFDLDEDEQPTSLYVPRRASVVMG
jgi:hypothetical protein